MYRSRFQKFTSLRTLLEKREINPKHASSSSILPIFTSNPLSAIKWISLSMFLRKVDRLMIFTKKTNLNKLYVDSNKGIFLSAGIVLRFMKQNESRFLKKRLKVWYNYLKAIRLLQSKHFIIHFSDLFGKKYLLFTKLKKSRIKIRWLLVRMFFNNFTLPTKRARRIKRWIKKKYYQLGVNERR